MVGPTGQDSRRRGNAGRIAIWAAPALILLLSLVAMQFSDEVDWSVFDFVVASILLFGASLTYTLLERQADSRAYRAAVGIAVAAALLLVWINLAVGIVGSEDNPANLLFFGVLAVGLIGALLARFRPRGMARALLATALAQAVVGASALVADVGSTGPRWPLEILALTGFFVALFAGSALLFRRAAQEDRPKG